MKIIQVLKEKLDLNKKKEKFSKIFGMGGHKSKEPNVKSRITEQDRAILVD